jgi:hypothetical protein
MKKAEQISPRESPGYRKELKKQAKRARRRGERQNAEDAPKQVRELTRGYST